MNVRDADPPIENRLSQFQAIRQRRLRQIFHALPAVIVAAATISVFARWYSQHAVLWTYVSGGLAYALSALVMRELFKAFPQTLLVVWRRNVLRPKEKLHDPANEPPLAKTFFAFLDQSEARLNSRASYWFGLMLMLAVMWLMWLLARERFSGLPDLLRHDPVAAVVSLLLLLTFCAGAFLGGVVGWRVVAIAQQLRELGKRFGFDLQIDHPDGCCGLRPLGDVCLTLAYVLTPPLVLVAGWLTVINLGGERFLLVSSLEQVQAVRATLLFLTLPLAALVLISFLLPLTTIHAAMESAQLGLQNELDMVSQRINEISIKLRTEADKLSAEEGTALERKIEFLNRVYNRNSRIPTWPVRLDHLWRIATTQVVPVIGIGTSGLGMLRSILDLIP